MVSRMPLRVILYTVREEYEALCRDHQGLIDFGASYATFDAMGKW